MIARTRLTSSGIENGFRDVVVRAGVQTDDPVDFGDARRQHHDRDDAALANPSAHLHAGQPRQQHVEDQDVVVVDRRVPAESPSPTTSTTKPSAVKA
jgi:hypothetical protein